MILPVHCSGGGGDRRGGSSDPNSGASGNPDQQVRGRGRTWGLRINLSHSSWLPPIAHWSVPAKCVHPFMRCVWTQFDLLPRTQHFLLLPVLHWPLSSQMWCKSSIDRFLCADSIGKHTVLWWYQSKSWIWEGWYQNQFHCLYPLCS